MSLWERDRKSNELYKELVRRNTENLEELEIVCLLNCTVPGALFPNQTRRLNMGGIPHVMKS